VTEAAPNSRGGKRAGMRVRLAEPSDLTSVADVHTSAFHGFFLAEMGRPFLVAYYRAVLNYGHGILLVAEGNEGINGFVSGFLDPVGFYQFMSRAKWRFVVPACLGVLRNPGLLRRLFRRTRRVMSTCEEARDRTGISCELSSVAVRPKHAGRGLGRLLVAEFLEAAASQGAECVFLTTDARQNEKVNDFYRNLGFELTRTFDADGQRPMNEYVALTHPVNPGHPVCYGRGRRDDRDSPDD
jgi:ribosomal protein S18 acetylase RimI-like enzyme